MVIIGGKGSGRYPKANHLKIAEGYRKDRINFDEPVVESDSDVLAAPDYLSDGAKRVWLSLAEDLYDKGVLKPWDLAGFEAFCNAVALYRRAVKEVDSIGLVAPGASGGLTVQPAFRVLQGCDRLIASWAGRFGLTPADRARLKAEGGEEMPEMGAERLLS